MRTGSEIQRIFPPESSRPVKISFYALIFYLPFEVNTKRPGNTPLHSRGETIFRSAVPPALREASSRSLPTLAHNGCGPYSPTEKRSLFPFRLSAPECSLYLLLQTALSVGDAVFLSLSEDKSLLHRIYLMILYDTTVKCSWQVFIFVPFPSFLFLYRFHSQQILS